MSANLLPPPPPALLGKKGPLKFNPPLSNIKRQGKNIDHKIGLLK